MEKEVNVLLEESATANVEKKTDLALDRAKKAAQKERKLGTRSLDARTAYVNVYMHTYESVQAFSSLHSCMHVCVCVCGLNV
jgi:hypothetical protein